MLREAFKQRAVCYVFLALRSFPPTCNSLVNLVSILPLPLGYLRVPFLFVLFPILRDLFFVLLIPLLLASNVSFRIVLSPLVRSGLTTGFAVSLKSIVGCSVFVELRFRLVAITPRAMFHQKVKVVLQPLRSLRYRG